MKTLLRFNHWQVFLLIYGIPGLSWFIPFSMPANPLHRIVALVAYIYLMVWVYGYAFAIGKELERKLPASYSPARWILVSHYVYICIAVIPIGVITWLRMDWARDFISLFVPVMIYFLISAFVVVRYAAKVFASVELGREAKPLEYAGYLFAIWFSFAGIWIVQPKIRSIVHQ